MLTIRRKSIAGGYPYRQIIVWRNPLVPLGEPGSWHIFIRDKQISFAEFKLATARIDQYLTGRRIRKVKY